MALRSWKGKFLGAKKKQGTDDNKIQVSKAKRLSQEVEVHMLRERGHGNTGNKSIEDEASKRKA